MKKILSIITFGFLLFSCQTEEEKDANLQSTENIKELVSLNDHLLFACQYINQHGLENIKTIDIENDFQINSSYLDSVLLDNIVLTRNFYFGNNGLEAIKYSSYTDSVGMMNSKEEIQVLKQELSSLFPSPMIDSTLYNYKWIDQSTSYQLKIYPKEGVDLVISKAANLDNTECVGDLYAAEEFIISLIQQKTDNNISLDSLQVIEFNGITVSSENNQITMTYSCDVSQKLQILDAKSIENSLTKLFGSKPEIKDDMHFWSYGEGQIQVDQMNQGFSFKFIQ